VWRSSRVPSPVFSPQQRIVPSTMRAHAPPSEIAIYTATITAASFI
jgi:hypothetical protein